MCMYRYVCVHLNADHGDMLDMLVWVKSLGRLSLSLVPQIEYCWLDSYIYNPYYRYMIAPSVGDIIELPDMVMTNIANWKDPPVFNGKTRYQRRFSIAMLVYQRVNLTKSLASPILTHSDFR